MSSFHRRAFLRFRSLAFNAPRRPRHPLLRIALGGDDRWFGTFRDPAGVSFGLWTQLPPGF